ncbi:MAG: c-type cytochrome [Planctomycetaceae bacterium]|jgi:YVTN family beta-propeller protein|nr:c-type cytochrome [Planctomycetaceae bacterium]
MKKLITAFFVDYFLTFVVGVIFGGIFMLFLTGDGIDGDDLPSFNFADRNKDGIVSKNEFKKVLIQQTRLNKQKLNAVTSNSTPPYSTPPVAFNIADKNKDGIVDKDEFKRVLAAANKNGNFNNLPISVTNNRPEEHDNCPIPDMPSDVKPASGFTWHGADETAIRISPIALTATRDGLTVFAVLNGVNSIGVIDTLQNKLVRSIPVAQSPNGIAISADDKFLYVTSGEYYGQLQIVNIDTGKIIKETRTGHTPAGVAITPDNKRIFVCNRFNNNVAEYELPSLSPLRQIKTIREPTSIIATPDGKQIFVTNSLPDDLNNYPEQPDKQPDAAAEITVINTTNSETKNIRLPKGTCNVNGICITKNGEYVYLTHLISQYWNSTDKLDFGQMNINAISIINLKEYAATNNPQIKTITLDDPELGAANPYAIAATDKQIFITIAGTDELITIDADKLQTKLQTETKTNLASNFRFLDGIKRRIKLSGKGARSIALAGEKAFVGLYFSDLIQSLDFQIEDEVTLSQISFGQTAELSLDRAGEMYWNDATLCYQQWQSCASCHPDARMTGLNWDLLHDGADNPKNTKSLILSHQTPPTMWLGDRRHAMQCTRTGFRFIMFSTPLREPCFAIDEYTKKLKPVTSPHLHNGKLSEKAERGKKLFNDPNVGCADCHNGEYFTDLKMYDVDSKDQFADQKLFDTPTLIEVWRTAPYMHDGRYKNLKDLLKQGKHGKENGNVENLTDTQIEELVEYVLSL